MPAGCEFICDNKNCAQYKSGIVIAGPWPLGKIEEIIGILSKNIITLKGSRKDYYNKLLEYKKEGVKFASIILPNSLEIPIAGYRLSFWSEKARCVYQMDIETNGKPLTEALMDQEFLGGSCPNLGCTRRIDNCELIPFEKTVTNGVNCPFCGIKMKQDRWFSNDK